ncbi:hypothetical protein KIN20_033652 [Parelaphostrongylus tenuis]|uniref:Uncharacterized protein n=1 Tax=Parelaphostrongylus tenuis TaxID=148309 RepID=A0AAD5R8F3_PARTN|nr:hypothetical protein KIN20_033652 [Parelaphostrongylus tenuis]
MFIVLVPKHKECSNIHYIPIIFSLFWKSASSQSRSFFFSLLFSLELYPVWMSSPKENMEEVEWPMNTRSQVVIRQLKSRRYQHCSSFSEWLSQGLDVAKVKLNLTLGTQEKRTSIFVIQVRGS